MRNVQYLVKQPDISAKNMRKRKIIIVLNIQNIIHILILPKTNKNMPKNHIEHIIIYLRTARYWVK